MRRVTKVASSKGKAGNGFVSIEAMRPTRTSDRHAASDSIGAKQLHLNSAFGNFAVHSK